MLALTDTAVGGRRARNRLLFGPHETNLGDGRGFSARHVAYYRRRAVGGCGTIVLETASVHASDWPYERAPLAASSGDGWQAIASAVQGEGALALASLGHAGVQGSSAYGQQPLWGPSRFPDPVTREVPMEMEREQIAAAVEGFRAAARIAAEAGLDGVEVNAGQVSLVRHFLSGLTNVRGDDYGADRLRFAREVLEAARAGLRDGGGDELVLGLRLACDEQAPWAGITPEAGVELARALAPLVDYVVPVRASIFDVGGTRPDCQVQPGFALPLTRAVRAALGPEVRVVAQGSIVDPAMAEGVLAADEAELVEMTRAQIADPDLARKLGAGVPEQVRPCVLCNQACKVRDARNPLVSCIGEPAAGHETEDAPVEGRDAEALDVLVVGAGPAGLEAARVAALRGHRVRVRERDGATGGRLRTAAHGQGRGRLALLPAWLARECERLGVAIETGSPVTEDELRRHVAEGGRAILATGSRATAAPPGHGVPRQTAYDVLRLAEDGRLDELPDGPVVVDDPLGGPIGVSVAELLAAHGRTVSLVTPDPIAANTLSLTGDLAPANGRLARAGVEIVRRRVIRSSSVEDGVVVEDRYTGARETLPAALVVDAGHSLPDDELAAALSGIPCAGDAVAPRTAYQAVLEGRRSALALGGTR